MMKLLTITDDNHAEHSVTFDPFFAKNNYEIGWGRFSKHNDSYEIPMIVFRDGRLVDYIDWHNPPKTKSEIVKYASDPKFLDHWRAANDARLFFKNGIIQPTRSTKHYLIDALVIVWVCLVYIRDWFEQKASNLKLFIMREKQLYYRDNGEVHFIALSGRAQILIVIFLVLWSAWIVYSNILFFLQGYEIYRLKEYSGVQPPTTHNNDSAFSGIFKNFLKSDIFRDTALSVLGNLIFDIFKYVFGAWIVILALRSKDQ